MSQLTGNDHNISMMTLAVRSSNAGHFLLWATLLDDQRLQLALWGAEDKFNPGLLAKEASVGAGLHMPLVSEL